MADKPQTSELEERFNAIIKEYGPLLRSAIVRVCPRDLGIRYDDVEQEARLRLWRAILSEREIRNLPSYIYRVAVTVSIDAMRQAKARREKRLEAEPGDNEPIRSLVANPSEGPDRTAERNIVIEKVEAILQSFVEERRRAVGLHLQGMTTTEIAELMQWTEPKARNTVYRALNELRGRLRAQGVEFEIE